MPPSAPPMGPLVAPLDQARTPELAAVIASQASTVGFVPNSLLTLQRKPEIAAALVNLLGAVMVPSGKLSGELKRLIAGAASLAAGCRYCQAHAASGAVRAGGATARAANLADWERSRLYTEPEKAAFAFAQAAAAVPNAVDDKIAADLKRYWSDDDIVEILAVVSLFGFLNRWNDSMGTTLEEEPRAVAHTVLREAGWTPGKHG